MVAAHPVGGPVDRQHDAVVEEAVEDGGGDGCVVEDLAPAGDAAVGGEDDRAVLERRETTWKRWLAASAGRGR